MKPHQDAVRWPDFKAFHAFAKENKSHVYPTKQKSSKCYLGPVRLGDMDCKEFGNRWAYYLPRSGLVVVTVYGKFGPFKPNKDSFSKTQIARYGLNPDGSKYPWVEGTDRRRFN